MKTTVLKASYFKKAIIPYLFFAIFLFNPFPSFSQINSVCDNGDCPEDVFSVQINQPLDGAVNPGRTEAFKEVYLTLFDLKKKQVNNWEAQFLANELGGTNCMRMNQVEAYLAHEVERNPEFKNFLNKNGVSGNDFMEQGFQASRRAINLETRMKSKCPNELRKIKDTQNPSSEEIRQIYQKLGIALGYFDEQGNQLKPLKDFKEDAAEKIASLKNRIENLTPDKELKKKLNDCENGLNKLVERIQKLEDKHSKRKQRFKKLLALPGKLLVKVSDLNDKINNLKLPLNGIPIVGDILNALDLLVSKSGVLANKIERLKEKEKSIQDAISLFEGKLEKVRNKCNDKKLNLEQLDKELVELIAEKSGVKEKLKNGDADVEDIEKTVREFINKHEIFETKADCKDQTELENEVEELKNEEDKIDEQIDTQEKEIKEAESEANQIENETEEIEEEIKNQNNAASEVKKQEEEIKTEYGEDIKLEPVSKEEWSESFQVERQYWEAVFHPDDEVVEGFKGRYFEVQLKDAEKNVKLLFGPGEYNMSKTDFRKKYGKTIGSFVTEALAAMKKNDQEKVQLFIQGSADIAGATTFSGNLDDQFLYEEIKLLPMKEGGERFGAFAVTKKTPKNNFRNPHLPNLRAQYLKEMIQIYSKKFEPVILEGAVKDFNDEGERNAIIYLFIPDKIMTGN